MSIVRSAGAIVALTGALAVASTTVAHADGPGCAGFNCPQGPPAPTDPPKGGSNDGGLIASVVTVTVHGGPGKSGQSGHGGRSYTVSSPCGYIDDGTGADFYKTFPDGDQLFISAAEAKAHGHDTKGHYYVFECELPFANTPEGLALANDQIAKGQYEIFREPGNPPRVAVPPTELASIASDEARRDLPTPQPAIAPTTQTETKLPTWVWLTGGTASDVSVTAAAPPNSVTVTGHMTGVNFTDLPASATFDSGCAGGGTPYTAGGKTDCSITFGQAAPAVSFTVTTTWQITVTGAQLTGPPTVTRTSNPITLAVGQIQAVGGH